MHAAPGIAKEHLTRLSVKGIHQDLTTIDESIIHSLCILGDSLRPKQVELEKYVFLRLTIDNIFEFALWATHARAAQRLNAP